MDEIARLIARMCELEPKACVYGPAAEETIAQLEAAFGHPMPPSYRSFLARFGALSILNSSYSGIINDRIAGGMGTVWTDTQSARQWCQLPEHYLVVQADGDGFKCLDFGRVNPAGEHPVIYHLPFRETPLAELAASYQSWLAENLQEMVAVWEEEE